ncbi:hypothetical protein DPMN_187060 [Dreissena polymorpha]|uniref:Uncharacterized protein n=1 Tax=Dreissena polymorpha TaxID=45954 RepID=A0A9D4DNS6_DREPO|nr:hypothetical protein DPMN_187060 [Dreissena polymorpha]
MPNEVITGAWRDGFHMDNLQVPRGGNLATIRAKQEIEAVLETLLQHYWICSVAGYNDIKYLISVTRCCCRLHVLLLGGILCMTIQEAVGAMFNRSSFLPVRISPLQFPLLRSGPF